MTKIFGFVALCFFADVSWAQLLEAYTFKTPLESSQAEVCRTAVSAAAEIYTAGVTSITADSPTGQVAAGAADQSSLGLAGADVKNTAAMTLANEAARATLVKAAATCRVGCKNAELDIQTALDVASASSNTTEVYRLQKELMNVKTVGADCSSHYEGLAAITAVQEGASGIATQNALNTKNDLTIGKVFNGEGVSAGDNPTWIEKAGKFVSNNWGKMAIGLGIGYMAKSRSDQKADEAKAQQLQAEAAKAAIPCTADNASENSKCSDYLKADCAKVVNLSSVRCKGFTATYCSSNDGMGTQLCKDSLARTYCDNANLASQRSNCYSCRDLNSRASADCTARPDLCMHENSMAEMAQWKATCPDDPVFTDPKWAGVTAGQSLTAAATTTDAATSAALSRKPAEISPAFGPGLLSQTSNVIQQLCAGGHLNDCGSRSGITQ